MVYAVSEGFRFAADTTLRVVECHACKMPYAIPESLYEGAIEYPGDDSNGWKLCCPLGHTWWYSGSNPETKLDQAEASRIAFRAAATRARNERDKIAKRANAGVCPCCNRTFKQLARHMASQHPDWNGGEHDA